MIANIEIEAADGGYILMAAQKIRTPGGHIHHEQRRTVRTSVDGVMEFVRDYLIEGHKRVIDESEDG